LVGDESGDVDEADDIQRLDAMERLLRELKKDHKLGPKDRKHGSR
jgi:hypothetical protein